MLGDFVSSERDTCTVLNTCYVAHWQFDTSVTRYH